MKQNKITKLKNEINKINNRIKKLKMKKTELKNLLEKEITNQTISGIL